MKTKLLPCPFCGTEPTVSPEGSTYEISCDECGQAVASVQISDYMTLDERIEDVISPPHWLHQPEYIKRAKAECEPLWNMRKGL